MPPHARISLGLKFGLCIGPSYLILKFNFLFKRIAAINDWILDLLIIEALIPYRYQDRACLLCESCVSIMQNPLEEHWNVVKRIMRYLSGTASYGLHIQKSTNLRLTSYSHSDLGSDPNDRKSTSGIGAYLGPKLVSWSSKKQHAVSRSSTKIEYRSLASLVANLFWIKNLLNEIQYPLTTPPIVCYGNLIAILLAVNLVLHSKSKLFELDLHFVIDHLTKGRVQISCIPAHARVANIHTKPISSSSFATFRSKLRIVDAHALSLRGGVKSNQLNGMWSTWEVSYFVIGQLDSCYVS